MKKPIFNFQRFNESVESAEFMYSTSEMEKSMRELINTVNWPGPKIHIQVDVEKSTSATTLEQVTKLLDQTVSKNGKDKNTKWYIWQVKAGGSFNKPGVSKNLGPTNVKYFDLNKLVDMAKKQPDVLSSLTLSFTNDEKEKFDAGMSDWSAGD